MKGDDVARAWEAAFGPAFPAGFICRPILRERWVRIHSLPDSKRYPESAKERREVLRRHNAAATYVLGKGDPCVLFVARFDGDEKWADEAGRFASTGPFDHAFSRKHDEQEIRFFFAPLTWMPGAYDELLLGVADDLADPMLIANLGTATAYSPYDGGADLFLASPAAATEMRSRLSPWLSSQADGL